MSKIKILISGGTGFIGKEFINSIILDSVFELHLIVREESNIEFIEKFSSINFYSLSEFSLDQIVESVQPNTTFNFVCSYDNSNYDIMYESNFLFGKKLIDSCINNDVEYFINIHTLSTQLKSKYVITKTLFLQYLESVKGEIKIFNISPELIYGNNYYDNNLTKYLVKKLINNKPIIVQNGSQKRDFLHINDLISALRVILLNKNKFKGFTQFDVASGTLTSVKDFSAILIKLFKDLEEVEIKIHYQENLTVPSYDLSNIKSLGWKSKTSIKEGLSLIFHNYNLNKI